MSDLNGQLPSRKTLWLRAVGATDLDPRRKAVAWAIGSYMNTEASCWPSEATIAVAASVSERTVQRSIPMIEATGLLVVSRERNRRGNKYIGAIPKHYWGIWKDDLVERLVDKMILGWDEDLANSDRPVTVPMESALSSENSDTQTRNGVTPDPNGDTWNRNSDTAVSPEVDEVDEADIEGPESLGGPSERFRGEADFVEILTTVFDEEEATT